MNPGRVTERSIRVHTRPVGDNQIEATGTLVDEIRFGASDPAAEDCRQVHNMSITVVVRYPEFEIVSASMNFEVYPDPECSKVPPVLQKLVGMRIVPGFTKAVQERIGREQGCVHLLTLVLALTTPVYQASKALFWPKAAGIDYFEPHVGTCLAWRRDGPLHRSVQQGKLLELQVGSKVK